MALSMQVRGILEAMVSAFCFALIPYFFLPLLKAGFTPEAGGFYRLFLASMLSLGMVIWRKQSLRLPMAHLKSALYVALAYTVVTLGFFTSLTMMPSGIAATLLFTNPLFVMLFMYLFYKERVEAYKIVLSLMTCLGIAIMSGVFAGKSLMSLQGFICIMCASLAYACYIISISYAKKNAIPNDVLSFYLFSLSSLGVLLYALVEDAFMLPRNGQEWGMLVLLALCTAFLSNILLIMAIAKIGSTLTAILGTLEPVIAVIIGISLFSEPANFFVLLGISLTILCVALITIIPFLRHFAPARFLFHKK